MFYIYIYFYICLKCCELYWMWHYINILLGIIIMATMPGHVSSSEECLQVKGNAQINCSKERCYLSAYSLTQGILMRCYAKCIQFTQHVATIRSKPVCPGSVVFF